MAAFGTSGLRGPATDFTQELCTAYVTAFLERCEGQASGKTAYVGADLRDSSPRIAGQCLAAIKAAGWTPVWAGNVPTRALNTHTGRLEDAVSLFTEWSRPEAGVIKAILEV